MRSLSDCRRPFDTAPGEGGGGVLGGGLQVQLRHRKAISLAFLPCYSDFFLLMLVVSCSWYSWCSWVFLVFLVSALVFARVP